MYRSVLHSVVYTVRYVWQTSHNRAKRDCGSLPLFLYAPSIFSQSILQRWCKLLQFCVSFCSIYFIVAACNVETYRLLYVVVFLWVTPATKSTKFGGRYLGEGLSEEDEIFQVARGGGLIYNTTQTGNPWHWGTKILKGVKNFCNAFLQAVLTDLDEI